jgi:hypothetical protein
MISASRFLGLAAAGTALVVAGALGVPANAQGPACKAEAITVSGKASFRPFSKTKQLDGKSAAMADAIAKWERRVGSKFGASWKTWARAKDATFHCEPAESGKIIGSSFIGCTITGRPCATASAAAAAPFPGRERSGGSSAAARTKGPPPPDTPPEVSGNPRWSPDYDREMQQQERLAEQRRKAESEAYEREMALQEKLATERWKGEYKSERGPPSERGPSSRR